MFGANQQKTYKEFQRCHLETQLWIHKQYRVSYSFQLHLISLRTTVNKPESFWITSAQVAIKYDRFCNCIVKGCYILCNTASQSSEVIALKFFKHR